jgi:isopentenyldiphosphate isomerase
MRPLSDDQDELFQVVDAADQPVAVRSRAACHADPALIHRSVFVLVETSSGMLYQRRGYAKDTNPGCWDVACAGHVAVGESYEQAALRELAEELGLDPVRLQPVGKTLLRLATETEMAMVFRVRSDGPFRIAPPEVAGVLACSEQPGRLTAAGELVLAFAAATPTDHP